MSYPAGGYRNTSSRNNREGGSQGTSRAFLAPLAGAAPVMPELAKALGYPTQTAAAAGGSAAFARAAMFGGRLALRFLPWLGAAYFAYQLYRVYHNLMQPFGPWLISPEWVKQNGCSNIGRPQGTIKKGPLESCGYLSHTKSTSYKPIVGRFMTYVEEGPVFIGVYAGWLFNKDHAYYQRASASNRSGVGRVVLPRPDYVQPLPWPSMAPWLLPILQPVPTPQPIPHRVLPDVGPSPDVPAKEQPQVGYGFAPVPSWVFRPPADVWADPTNPDEGNPLPDETVTIELPVVGQVDVPGDPNYAQPDPVPKVDPSTDVSTEGSTDHEYKRPGPRTKERKFHVTPTAGNFIVALYNMASEARDFVDALYWALPKNRRLKGHWVQRVDGRWLYVRPSLQAKAMAIYDGINDINMRTAAINLVANQLTDALYGRIGSASRTAAQKVFEQTGYSPSRTQTVSRRGTGGMVSAPDVIRQGVEKAFDQFWPKE